MRDIDRRQVLFGFQNFSGEFVRFAQGELRIDHDHVLFTGNHGRVHVIPVGPGAGMDFQLEDAIARPRQSRKALSEMRLPKGCIQDSSRCILISSGTICLQFRMADSTRLGSPLSKAQGFALLPVGWYYSFATSLRTPVGRDLMKRNLRDFCSLA